MSAAALRDPLALGAPLRFGPGRRAQPLRAAFDRELTVEDLLLAESSDVVQGYMPLKKLRQRHHQLARVLAQGLSDIDAAIVTGYDNTYVTNMRTQDPAFKELLAYYTEMEAQQYGTARADMHERLANLGFDSIAELHQRLEDTPEAFNVKELLAIVEATSDRTGHGKTSTVNHEHEHSISAATLGKIKAAALGQAVDVAEDDRQSLLRLAARRTAAELPEAQEGDWIEGSGHCVREEGHSAPPSEVPDGDDPLP